MLTLRKAYYLELGASIVNLVLVFTIVVLSLVIRFIAEDSLSIREGDCNRWKCDRHMVGCLWTADTTNTWPCKLCLTVALVGMSCIMLLLVYRALCLCLKKLVIAEWPLSLTLGGFYIAWFAVAGNDFTKKFLDHRSLPRDSKRHAVISIMWACMGVACVQFILAATVLIHWKNLREVHKWKLQQQQQQLQQQLTAVQPLTAAQTYQYGTAPPPPPPPAGYPAIAAGSSSLLPPLTPPTGSCPYNVPLQPAGHYSHPTPPGGYPGSGAAPLLGGYTNSTVVPPVGGGGNVLLPQQPAV